MATRNVVHVSGFVQKKEKEAAAATTVGSLVSIDTSGKIIHGVSGITNVIVVDSSSTTGMDRKTSYAIGDQVPILYPAHGTELYVNMGSATAITAGAKLQISAGGVIAGTTNVVGFALEASGDGKVLMEVLK